MENKGTFYITTAIPYASQKPHIGNSYDIVVSDIVARYKRALGYDVFFCTGTDEHGQKIENLAAANGVSPKEYANGVSDTIQKIWAMLGSTHTHFIKTTDDYHVDAAQKIFKKLYDQGDIYKDAYEGWYCVPDESFFTETQAKDGVCPDCGRPLVRAKEEAYFFKMSKYQDKLLAYLEENPDFITPENIRREMINNFIKPGLQDLCVSRSSFSWGVPVDFDRKHVIYVWLDALINYITALGYTPDKKGENYVKYWPCDVHVIGKDIARFHTIYWPIFLMALGEPLPKKVFAHPWLMFGSDKMSKSRGNVIYPDDLVDLFGLDAVRYYLAAEMPLTTDGSITYESVISRFNTDLANTFGNLASRTVAMTKKYFGGTVPSPAEPTEFDGELKDAACEAYKGFTSNLDSYRIADAVEAATELSRKANKYIDQTMPWALAKDESQKGRLATVIYNLLETLRISALILSPVMPNACEKILSALGAEGDDFESAAEFGGLKSGTEVGDLPILFARIDEAKMLQEINGDK